VSSRDGKFLRSNWNGDPNEVLKGFTFKHGRTAHTKGVHMWSDIFLYDAPDGEKIAIVLIDTQGLFEPTRPTRENTRIFGLSNLIASIQIYNLFQVVQENELEYLEMTVKLSEMISKKVKASKSGKEYKPFQNLIFLIRDFPDDEFALGYEGGDAYLNEEVLSLTKASDNEVVQSVRENIHISFEKINGFLLPFPGKAVRQKSFDGSWKDLDSNFVTNLENIIESMFKPENLVKKKIFDVDVTGETYRQYINDYLESFKSGSLPKIESLLHMTIMRQMQILMDKLTAEYKTKLEIGVDLDDENLLEKFQANHEATKSKIFLQFDEADSLADDNTKVQFKTFLIKKFDDWNKQIVQHYNEHKKIKLVVDEMRKNHEEQTRKLQIAAEEHQDKFKADLDRQLQRAVAQNKDDIYQLIHQNDQKLMELWSDMEQRFKVQNNDNEMMLLQNQRIMNDLSSRLSRCRC
jgi:atlastin